MKGLYDEFENDIYASSFLSVNSDCKEKSAYVYTPPTTK